MVSFRNNRKTLSLHKMFLEAPDSVIAAVAHYLRGKRREAQKQNLILRGYIEENLSRYDVSNRLDRTKLEQKGRIYHLVPLFDELNRQYFNGELELAVTWFGAWGRKSRSRIVFGQYHDNLRLIKIHRILDDPFIPEFFLKFILYHEMLHAVIPGHIDERGRFCIHGKAFKERERQFGQYAEAIAWEKKNKNHFFKR